MNAYGMVLVLFRPRWLLGIFAGWGRCRGDFSLVEITFLAHKLVAKQWMRIKRTISGWTVSTVS